mgnify:CR=1 FL=1
MKKYIYHILIAIYLIAGISFILSTKVERYGVVERFSTYGDMRFKYYDIKTGRVLEDRKNYPWFFATVDDIKDNKKVDDYVKYISEHEGYIFKIAGNREKDDCSSFGNGMCLESITVKDITAYSLLVN